MPGLTTYQARIVKPDGLPLEANGVSFRFTFLNPAGSCILYIEDYSAVSMANSGGLISFSLGSGTKTFPTSASVTFKDVFNNATPSMDCMTSGTYSPGASDTRKIVMQFRDTSGWQTLPAMAINAVPYAMYATQADNSVLFNGKTDTAFVEKSNIPTCLAGQALHYNLAGFTCVSVGGASGTISASDVTMALGYSPVSSSILSGYTPAASYTGVATSVGNLGTSVTAITSTLNQLSASMAALSGGGITSFNGSTSATQSFQIVSTGLAANISTINGVHTLAIPNAASASVTAGLLSNADYLSFSGKLNATSAAVIAALGYTPAASGSGVSVTSGSIAAALGYAPVNPASLTTLTSAINAVSSSLTSFQATTAASFAALSGSGIGSFNGSSSATQSLGNALTGTTPAFVTANGVHTLNIPYASAPGTTAGLISNSDYSLFSTVINKITSSAASIAQVLGYTPADQATVTTLSSTVGAVSTTANAALTAANTKITSSAAAIEQVLGYMPASGSASVNSAAITSALGYTPADAASVTALTNNKITSSAASVQQVLGYVPADSAALSSFQSTTAASFAAISGSGISSLNGSTSATQNFANGTGGTAPAFVTAAGVHTLNVPFASAGATTAGVISNADYSLFSTVINKITSSATSIAQVLGYAPADQAQVTTLSSTIGAVSTTANSKITSSAASIREVLGYTPAASGSASNIPYYATATSLYLGPNGVTSGSAGNNTAVGTNTMTANSTGTENVAMGESALTSNTSGFANTAIGWYSLYSNTNGGNNTAIGNESLESNISGFENTGLGSFSLMRNTTGNFNTGIGTSSLSRNLTGHDNVAVGTSAGFGNETGNRNIFIGRDTGFGGAGLSDVSGSVMIGYGAGSDIRTGGDYNILVGYQAGNNITTGNRNILIGHDIDLATATTNQALSIGNLIFGTGLDGTGTTISSGRIGIGVTAPVTKLDVSGGLRISMESGACSAALAGTLRYNGGIVEYCNGTIWSAFGVAGAGITNFNGSASGSQSLANALSGTAPAFVSANGVHTLNIPYASVGTTTAGLISNAEYALFSTVTNKITSSAAAIAQALGYTPAASGSFSLSSSSIISALGYTPADAVSFTTLSSTVDSVSAAVASKITSSAASVAEVLGYAPAASDAVANLKLPANSDIIMRSCPAGWTDLAATSGPSLSHAGVTTRVCRSPGVASLIPANSIVLMMSCPSGWTSLGITSPAPSVNGFQQLVACQAPAADSFVPAGAQVLAGTGTCPSGWSLFGTISGPTVNCNGSTCRVCESPGGMAYPRIVYGGTAGVSATGAIAILRGGAGGSTSGNGGSTFINGGSATDGHGGAVTIAAGTGATLTGLPRNGGLVSINSGNGVSAGVAGNISLQAGTNSVSYAHVLMQQTGGNVGIGLSSPVTKLDVSGAVRISMDSAACDATYAGTIRYNAGTVEFCNGSAWAAFGAAGSGLANFNGSTSATQTFASGNSGTSPSFSTVNGVHTLNIPFASEGTTTAGVISNSDYSLFSTVSNKITSSAASIVEVLGYVPANSATVSANNGAFVRKDGTVSMTGQLVGIAGSNAAPSFTFDGDTDSGIFNLYNDSVAIAANATTLVTFDTAAAYSEVPFQINNTAQDTGYSFSNGVEMFSPNAGVLGFRTNGSERARFTATGNLGLGTTTPDAKLTISGTVGGGRYLNFVNLGDDGSASYVANIKYTIQPTYSWDLAGNPISNAGLHFKNESDDGSGNPLAGKFVFDGGIELGAGVSGDVPPLRFNPSPLSGLLVSGAIEYDGSNLYFTDSTKTRRALASTSTLGTFSGVSAISNTGNITLNANSGTANVIVNGGLTVSSTGAMRIPTGTTAQQPANTLGMVRYNSDTKSMEISDGTSWNAIVQDRWVSGNNAGDTLTVNDGNQTRQYVPSASAKTVNLPDGATLPLGWNVTIQNLGSTVINVTTQGTDTYAGVTSSTVFPIVSTSFNYATHRFFWQGPTRKWAVEQISGSVLRQPPGRPLVLNPGVATTAGGQTLTLNGTSGYEGAGGQVNINAGFGGSAVSAAAAGGSISATSGNGVNGGAGGAINLTAGYSATGAGGNINLNPGAGSTTGSVIVSGSLRSNLANSNIGVNGVALGISASASGANSVALGSYTVADANYSTAMGYGAWAKAQSSQAFGYMTEAIGQYSTAMGNTTQADSYNSFVIGQNNLRGGNPNSWVETDPLFQIGNGSAWNNPGNAFTVLKNGSTSIGSGTPVAKLSIYGTSNSKYLELNNSGLVNADKVSVKYSIMQTDSLYGSDDINNGALLFKAEVLNIDNGNENLGGTFVFDGNVGVGVTGIATYGSKVTIASGSTYAVPLKIVSGALVNTPTPGAIEYNGFNFYITNGAGVRSAIGSGGGNTLAGFSVSATAPASGQVLTWNTALNSWMPTNPSGGGSSQFTTSGTSIYYTSGNTGLGTSNPVARMHVASSTTSTTDPSANSLLTLQNTANTSGALNSLVFKGSAGNDHAAISIQQSFSTNVGNRMILQTKSQSGTVWNANQLVLSPMGFIGIGVSNPTVALDVVGDIQYTGTITDASDRRLKENIEPLGSAISKVRQIKTYSYVMKDDPNQRIEYGVMAQDMLGIIPNLVKTIRGDFYGVNYVGLIPWSIRAIQEVDSETQNLRRENAEIKRELASVKEKNQALEQKLDRIIELLEQQNKKGEK